MISTAHTVFSEIVEFPGVKSHSFRMLSCRKGLHPESTASPTTTPESDFRPSTSSQRTDRGFQTVSGGATPVWRKGARCVWDGHGVCVMCAGRDTWYVVVCV